MSDPNDWATKLARWATLALTAILLAFLAGLLIIFLGWLVQVFWH